MWLDWSDWKWWDDNKWKTWINLALESRLMRWRDGMRWLMEWWVSSTDFLIQSIRNREKLSVEEVLELIKSVFDWENIEAMSDETRVTVETLRDKLLSKIWDKKPKSRFLTLADLDK